jgi:hypothetical protein
MGEPSHFPDAVGVVVAAVVFVEVERFLTSRLFAAGQVRL